jgi:fatty-acyl-CoA synthase
MTAVGKIFKPTLRRDAALLTVRGLLAEQNLDGEVEVTAGGPRGMRVTVELADDDGANAAQLQDVLNSYLFEATVTVGRPESPS